MESLVAPSPCRRPPRWCSRPGSASAAGRPRRRQRPSTLCQRWRCRSPAPSAPSARRSSPSRRPRGGSHVVTCTTPPASCRGWRCTTHAPSAAPASHHTSRTTLLQSPAGTGRWCCHCRRRSKIHHPLLTLMISSVRRRLLAS